MNEELKYRIAITMIKGIGPMRAKELIAHCGGAEAVFHEKKNKLLKVPGVGPAVVNAIISQKVLKDAEEEIAFIEKTLFELPTILYEISL